MVKGLFNRTRIEQDRRAMETVNPAKNKVAHRLTRIVADDREAGSDVVAALRSREDVRLEIGHLTVGDYEVAGRCLIERKRVVDFATSLIDGRLFRQAYRLRGTGGPVR
jgi:ERCC4-type nuclease